MSHYLNQFRQITASHRSQIINAFHLLYMLLVVVIVIGAIYIDNASLWLDFSHASATAAALTLSITLLPGIIRRFQLQGTLKELQLLITMFRRQLGVLSFLFATTHFIFQKVLPAITFSTSPFAQNIPETFGAISLALLTPLAITSNDTAVQLLKKYWKKLHQLVYLIIVLVAAHVVLIAGITEPISLIVITTAILELASLAHHAFKNPSHAN